MFAPSRDFNHVRNIVEILTKIAVLGASRVFNWSLEHIFENLIILGIIQIN